jgi:hypothetical protein
MSLFLTKRPIGVPSVIPFSVPEIKIIRADPAIEET